MIVDKVKLKALAAAAIEQHDRWVAAGEPWPVWNRCLLEMQAAANPATVLTLLAENERNTKNAAEWEAASLHWMEERDQLKAKLAELESIGELINSQDNRCTDQPMFAVMEKRGMITLDTHDHDRIEWYDPVNVSTADDRTAARLEALHDGGRDVKHWERYAIKDVDVFVTACFTEQGCKDFLARDGHNHRQPFIYAFGSYRNGEYQSVRNWLKSLPKKTGD
jgi:hypothetical protein